MGEISQDFVDGTCCSFCGQYFQDKQGNLYAHGYSVACLDCWDEDCGLSVSEKGIKTF